MLPKPTAAAAVGLYLFALPGTAAAQIDYRNLDDERPVATEDAYPVERYAFEILAPYRFERERGGGEVHLFVPELEYGLLSNTQLGLDVPLAVVDRPVGQRSDWGLAGLRLFALYNFNTESQTLPAFSLRTDVSLPVGSLAGDGARVSLKAIATRSWGRTRLHLNAVRGFGTEDDLSPAEALPRWAYSLAADRTLFRKSILLVGEILASREVRKALVEVNGALGVRYQWTPTLVLDLGIARRLRDRVGPDLEVTFGVSHAFALSRLMRGARR